MEKKLKVGQKVWTGVSDPKEAIVSKVGFRYFELDNFPRRRFFIDTLVQDSEYSSKIKVYLSKEEILAENEHTKMCNMVSRYFYNTNVRILTTEQLKAIAKIVNIG